MTLPLIIGIVLVFGSTPAAELVKMLPGAKTGTLTLESIEVQ
jgi:hypothetical protein